MFCNLFNNCFTNCHRHSSYFSDCHQHNNCFGRCCNHYCCIGPTGPTGPIGPRGPVGPMGPAGELSSSFIFSRIIFPSLVDVENPIPFPFEILSNGISNPLPFTTFTFAQTGYYLINLTITTDIQQITTVLVDTGGPQATTYTLSPSNENKVLSIILAVNEVGSTLQFINSLGTGNITSANLTMTKIAEI